MNVKCFKVDASYHSVGVHRNEHRKVRTEPRDCAPGSLAAIASGESELLIGRTENLAAITR